MIRVISLLILCMLVLSSVALGQVVTKVIDNGSDANRINIVVFGDGYIAGQESQFDSDVDEFLVYMFDREPFDEYHLYYNVYTIFTESNEEGSDHPSVNIYKDTYFSSTYDSYGVERLITIPPNDLNPSYSQGAGKVFSLLSTHVPAYDVIVILVNDPQYGGSGGTFAISSTNSAAPEIVMHELGHSFGNLADEYDTYTPGYSGRESYNTTAETVRELIKWNMWIDALTPIPTPETSEYGSVVGLFEGACYETTGWYRPWLNCKMKSLGPDFCPVCREKLITAGYNLLMPIETYTPIESVVEMSPSETKSFGVGTLVPATHSFDLQWYLDGMPLDGETGNYIDFDGSLLNASSHILEARVADNTVYVRNDPSELLKDSHSWAINVVFDCGDVFGDGDINLLDILFLIDFVYGTPAGPSPDPYTLGDVNSDTNIDLLDILYLISFVYDDPPGPEPVCTM